MENREWVRLFLIVSVLLVFVVCFSTVVATASTAQMTKQDYSTGGDATSITMNFPTPLTGGTVELYLTGDFDASDEGYTLIIEGKEVYSRYDIGFQDEPLSSAQADAHFIGTFSLPSSAIGKTRITIVGKTTSKVDNRQDPAARAWIIVHPIMAQSGQQMTKQDYSTGGDATSTTVNFPTPLTGGTVELYLTGDFDNSDEGYTLTIEGQEVYSKDDIGFQDEPLASNQADAHFIGTFSLPSSAIGKTRITIVGKTTSTVDNGRDPAARAWIVVAPSGYVNQSPIADFTWKLTTGNEVRFDASTSHDPDGHIVSYKWDFNNDGLWDHVSSTPVITHTFSHRLACRTELMVVDDQGQTDTIVRTPYLPAAAPTAKFAWEGLSPEGARLLVKPKTGDRIHFDASASSDPDGQIVKYEWDWDSDGAWDKESTNPVTEHSFVEAGTHQVTLRVTDNNGLTDQSTQAVVIERGDIIQTDFTFRVLNKSLHQIQFDASASIDTMGEIVRYEWDWNNDDSYDTAVEVPTIMNRFPEAGPYQVTLTIVDDQGNRASCTKEVP